MIDNYTIKEMDIEHALRKWNGKDSNPVNTNNIREWKANDKEFLNGFSKGNFTKDLVKKFIAKNKDSEERQRTGGYSIARKMWGGHEFWTNELNKFYKEEIENKIKEYDEKKDIKIVVELVKKLAKIEGTSLTSGKKNKLGIVSASKILFFTCPNMPIFIYDSVVGKALSMENLKIEEYDKFCNTCQNIINSIPSYQITESNKNDFKDKENWFKRRIFDLMLYRIGNPNNIVNSNC